MKEHALVVAIGVAVALSIIIAAKGLSMAAPASRVQSLCGSQIC